MQYCSQIFHLHALHINPTDAAFSVCTIVVILLCAEIGGCMNQMQMFWSIGE